MEVNLPTYWKHDGICKQITILTELRPLTNELHGAEPFLRSRQLCSYSRISQQFIKPKGSLPCSKGPSPVPILSQINPVHTTPSCLSKIHSNIILPPTSRSSQWSLSFWLSHQNYICISLLPQSCYMPCPSHPPWLDNSNYTWWTIQVMKLPIMQCALKFFLSRHVTYFIHDF
jgi:hypothetical protein